MTEAAIVLSVLLALVEQIVKHSPVGKHLTEHWDRSEIQHAHAHAHHASTSKSPDEHASGEHGDTTVAEVVGLTDADRHVREKKLIRRLRIQVRPLARRSPSRGRAADTKRRARADLGR